MDPDQPPPEDPVVVYDNMREAATRLAAVYARRITAGGPDDPDLAEMRAIKAAVEAVDPHDPAAQKTMTADLVRRRAELISG